MDKEVKDSYEQTAKVEAHKFYVHIVVCLKWIGLALFEGAVLGLIATAFAYSLKSF